jgi:Transposase, Mutator family
MARTTPRPTPTVTQTLQSIVRHCSCCGNTMWAAYHNYRTITTLEAVLHLTLQIRRCLNPNCPQWRQPYRPEAEGRLALPKHEFGLDVMAFVGHQRYAYHRSIPEIHHALGDRGVAVAQRTVTNLLERYDELLSLTLQDTARLRRLTEPRGRVILALDGLQPDMGHEVLWVFRDCLSGEVLLAQSLLSASHTDLATLLHRVKQALCVPIVAVVSDGQRSIRKAVQHALPRVPHQLCHFHYLREAAKPIYEADRHAKKELKKRVRGVRPIERQLETRTDPEADVIRGYCSAVRSALTDDGRPPLDASGLPLHARLGAVAASLERGEKRGPYLSPSYGCSVSSAKA